ncbi:RWD domain-containing protein 1 [Tetranychus urticae]|uniref:RWD domain-containing protein n=1 Tax=Tetranychus urticae TaxID=32264 RepID=T1JQN3_TETUR|nr:RWD domain-containing protein 1 [Tetranychus urticae]
MSCYLDDQIDELQALEAIYPNELEVISNKPPIKFSVFLNVQSEDHEEYQVKLVFELGENYPEEGPIIEVDEFGGSFEDQDRDELMEMLDIEVANNLGMVMVFTLVSTANEWLQKRCDSLKKRRIEEAERKRLEAEAEEMRRFEGTKVTVESFLAWKREFDAEMAALEKTQVKLEGSNKKLTGRELFEKDKSLIESDLKFLEEEGGEAAVACVDVKVDESLFQDVEDLDIDDVEDE